MAPPNAWTLFLFLAAVLYIYSATGVEPTKLTEEISSLLKIKSTTFLSPLITLKTPSGSPASETIQQV